jgi:hypothetical protein
MKKWLRRILIAALLAGVALGILYEYATHVGRGWLNDEAFYQGRPTSYWRVRCDDWLERFVTPAEAGRWIPPGISVPIVAFDEMCVVMIRPRPKTFWTGLTDRFRTADDRWQEDWPLNVLFGYPGSEPVLDELAQDEKYRLLTERPLQYAKVYRKMGQVE